MSFFKTLKRSLGFGNDTEEDDIIYADTAQQDNASHNLSHNNTQEQPSAENIAPIEFDPKIQERIFSKVIEVFNASLPQFLADTVDHQAQIQYLRDALDKDIRIYLDELSQHAEKYCEMQWQQTRTAMNAELEAMRTKAGDIEKKSDDIRQKQLSADRQKRALSERVHDLEAQIAKLEADREQFELENRSLVNRLKVMNIQQEDLDKMQAELQSLRDNPEESHVKEVEALKAQIAEMTEGIESLKEQNRVSKDMIDDLHHRLSEATKQIAEAAEMRKEYEEVSDKLDDIDKIMAANEEKIKRQKATIAARDTEIESLRHTVAENLRLQAEREKLLQAQIDNLKGKTSDTIDHTIAEDAPQISEADLSAIEQTFESGEWFTNTPPAPTPSMRPDEEQTDFGYRKPKRKTPPPNNDAQLSLF